MRKLLLLLFGWGVLVNAQNPVKLSLGAGIMGWQRSSSNVTIYTSACKVKSAINLGNYFELGLVKNNLKLEALFQLYSMKYRVVNYPNTKEILWSCRIPVVYLTANYTLIKRNRLKYSIFIGYSFLSGTQNSLNNDNNEIIVVNTDGSKSYYNPYNNKPHYSFQYYRNAACRMGNKLSFMDKAQSRELSFSIWADVLGNRKINNPDLREYHFDLIDKNNIQFGAQLGLLWYIQLKHKK